MKNIQNLQLVFKANLITSVNINSKEVKSFDVLLCSQKTSLPQPDNHDMYLLDTVQHMA